MISLGEPIALGGTCEIYAWQEGQILKLFPKWFPADEVEQEAKKARVIHQAGLPVPAVGEMIEVNGQLGIVYERVYGKSIVYAWLEAPWKLFHFARLFAQLQATIHSYEIVDLPLQRQRLKEKIPAMLPQALQGVVLNALTTLPDGKRLCHGDFHPNNVLLTERGPIIVDWINATQGDPLADVARTSLLITFGTKSLGSISPWLVKVIRVLFHICYIKRYQQLQGWDQKQFRAWRPVVAAAYLDPNNAKQEERLLELIKAAFVPPQSRWKRMIRRTERSF